MKVLPLFLSLFFYVDAGATPVLDTALGFEEMLTTTLIPDSQDQNLYYFFPSHYGLAEQDGRKLFAYNEKEKFLGTYGYVSSIFNAILSEPTRRALADAKSRNPQARFSPVPITQTEMIAVSDVNPLLSRISCQDYGGVVGQQMGCAWVIKPRQTKPFRELVRKDAIVQVLYYTYTFTALVEGKMTSIKHSVPVYFVGVQEGPYFFDSKGRQIP